MTLPVWPSELPTHVLVEGYQSSIEDGRLFTSPEQGPPSVRRRFTQTSEPMSCSIIISQAEMARLRYFRNTTLQKGSLPFLMPDQRFHEAELLDENFEVLTDENGEALLNSSYLVSIFGREWREESTPPYWRVSFDLIVMP